MVPNLNRIFPRFSIRAKLAIAFATIAVLPLMTVAAFTVQGTVGYLRQMADETLEYDLGSARNRVQREIDRSVRDVEYLRDEVLTTYLQQLLRGPEAMESAPAIGDFLSHAPTLMRVKLVAADGRLLHVEPIRFGEHPSGFELLYAIEAEALEVDARLLKPVEFVIDSRDGDQPPVTSAIALLMAIRDPDGRYLGAVVGEARADVIFSGIDESSPSVPAITGLISEDGLLLYHSTFKSDWSRLMAEGIGGELPGVLEAREEEPAGGTFETEDGLIVSHVPLGLRGSGLEGLTLYRALPVATLYAPIQRFNRWVLVTGVLVVLGVLALALLASRQLTRPIYRLKDGFSRLAAGEPPQPVAVETNDELEDLSRAFGTTWKALYEHRQRLQELVEERTRAFLDAHNELAGILEGSADAIVSLDARGHIRVWNQGAQELFGYAESEVRNRPMVEILVPPELRTSSESEYLTSRIESRGSVVGFRTVRVDRSGSRIPVSLTQTAIRAADGSIGGMSLIMRDARLQERLEEQLRRSERLAAVSVMAAGLAHEVNNPLAVVANRVECMEEELVDGCDPEILIRDLAVLREHTQRLQSVTRDLLRFARDYDDELGPLDLLETCRRVCHLLERTLGVRGIEVEIPEPLPLPPVAGSATALETVFMNLLLNAADAMSGGGSVKIAAQRSDVEESVELSFEDSGPGIPQPLRQRVFEPFFTTKDGQNGLGLGLALCRSIVERHGGRIWIEDGALGGGRFVVSIPLARRTSS